MSVELVTSNIWQTITAAARKSARSAHVAVAYVGQGASRLLPLRWGSRLVVDASLAAVKSGQTCPEELAKLIKKGVRVYSVPNLHAKVFAFSRRAFIGSTNVSRHSAHALVEAVVATTDPAAVNGAREFVRDQCLNELGPEAIATLERSYRPPRFGGGHPRRKRGPAGRVATQMPRVLLTQLCHGRPPEESEGAQESGRGAAKRRMASPRRHVVDDFWWRGNCPHRPGDVVLQVVDEGDGRVMVSPPGNVLHLQTWRRGSRRVTFVYLEVPKARRKELGRLA